MAAGVAPAEIPRKVNYQGRITGNVSGEALAGSHAMILRIYDVAGDKLLYVRGTGKVGIGTVAPLAKLHIETSELAMTDSVLQADAVVVDGTDAVLGLYSSASGGAGAAVTLSEITAQHLVDKWGIVRETASGGKGLGITYGTDNDRFENDLVMYLDDDGSVGIGTRTTGTYELRLEGDACATGGWTTCSDARLKDDAQGIGGALDKVLALRGVSFTWRTEGYEDRRFPEGRHYGVIAQEAEDVLPEIVRGGPDGERSVAYTEIIPVLIESIKELRAENETLRQRIEDVEMTWGRQQQVDH
jgi:hypothetical protein